MTSYDFLILAFFFLLLFIPFISIQVSLLLFLFGSLFFPYLHLGNIFIRFEVIYILWLLVFLLIKRKFTLVVSKVAMLYFVYIMLILLSTFVNLIQTPTKIIDSLIVLNGLLRPLLVIIIFSNTPLDLNFVRTILKSFLLFSIPLNLLSIFQFIGVDIVTKITLNLYTSPAITSPYTLIKTFGRFARVVSVFEFTPYTAIYTLMILLVVLTFSTNRENLLKQKYIYIIGALAFLVGILTLSATFFLGFGTLLGITLWLNFRSPRRLFCVMKAAVVIGISGVLLLAVSPEIRNLAQGGIEYQFQRILTVKVFKTRYDPEMGSLANAYKLISKNLILGNGALFKENVFWGDTFYISTLYTGGIVGFGIYLSFILWVLKLSKKRKELSGILGLLNTLVFQLTLLFLITGLGAPAFTMRRASEWYWAFLGMSLNQSLYRGVRECSEK